MIASLLCGYDLLFLAPPAAYNLAGERAVVELSQGYLCLAIAVAGRGDRRGKESMASVRLFRMLFCFLLSASAAARLAPLIEEFLGPSGVVDIFDTSNYGKLQLNNGLARTPQMGSVSEIPLFLHGLRVSRSPTSSWSGLSRVLPFLLNRLCFFFFEFIFIVYLFYLIFGSEVDFCYVGTL